MIPARNRKSKKTSKVLILQITYGDHEEIFPRLSELYPSIRLVPCHEIFVPLNFSSEILDE